MKKIMTICVLFAYAFFAQAYDIVATVSIADETKWYFDIELANNSTEFTAFQLDITLEGDVELTKDVLQTCDLMPNHTLMLAKPDGHYRVVGFNTVNEALKGTTGQLFTFFLDGDITGITINNIIFAKPDGTEVEAEEYVRALDRVNDPDAIKDAPAEQGVNKVVYNMEGKQVFKIDRRGIYIQNGKKIAVK